MALWSTYEIPSGAMPSELEVSLKAYLKGEEQRGLNNCAMHKHGLASTRAFYTTCNFNDIDHFVRTMDCSPSVAHPDEVRSFGSHMDHIVLMTKQGMTKIPKCLFYASTAFAPHLSHLGMQAKTEEFCSSCDDGFSECNRDDHAWGPELVFYATCAFESYADVAAGANKVMMIFEGRLATANCNILDHRGDLGQGHGLSSPSVFVATCYQKRLLARHQVLL